MIFVEELKDLKLYRKKFFMPIYMKDKKHGALSILLTPNVQSSMNVMTNKLMINRRYYESYYMESNVNYFINAKTNEATVIQKDNYIRNESLVLESEEEKVSGKISLTGYEKDVELFKQFSNPDIIRQCASTLGVQDLGSIPDMHFNIIDSDNLDTYNLAICPNGNTDRYYINADIISYDVFTKMFTDGDYGEFIRDTIEFILKKYVLGLPVDDEQDPSTPSLQEGTKLKKFDAGYLTRHLKYTSNKGKYSMNKLKRNVHTVSPEKIKQADTNGDGKTTPAPSTEKPVDIPKDAPTESYLLQMHHDNYMMLENMLLVLGEADDQYDHILRQILYNDRLRQAQEVTPMYQAIKHACPFIKYTYLRNMKLYKSRNAFIDLSYYNEIFFKNNTWELDRGVKLYAELLERLLEKSKFEEYGYTKRVVFIPVKDWDMNANTKMWIYKDGINPISIIYRLIERDPERLKKIFKDLDVVFLGESSYFKINFSKVENIQSRKFTFKKLISSIRSNSEADLSSNEKDDTMSNKETTAAIINNITDQLDAKGVHVTPKNLLGDAPKEDTSKDKKISSEDKAPKDNDKEIIDKRKEELIDAIEKKAEGELNTDAVLDSIDKQDDSNIKELISDIAAGEEENGPNISKARSSRMNKLHDDFVNDNIKGTPIRELLKPDAEEPLKATDIPVTINKEEWKGMKFVNFDKDYDINMDIAKILDQLSRVSYPLSVLNIKVSDNSTSEDYIDLYTVQLEDFRGKRFTIKFDVPKFKNGYFLKLRGNEKNIQNQFANMPIIKTDQDTCQIITNYNKVFVYRKNTASGKSMPSATAIVKALNKYQGKNIKIVYGDCSNIAGRYELPIDYLDLGSIFFSVETPTFIIYFDQDTIRDKYQVDLSKGLPFAYDKKHKEIIYFNGYNTASGIFSTQLADMLCGEDEEFLALYRGAAKAVKYSYTACRIMNHYIPVVVVCAYSEGLTSTLKKAGINYSIKEKLSNEERHSLWTNWIKFSDGYILYNVTYSSSLLMNGLKLCMTEDKSLADIDKRSTYLDFFDDLNVPRIVSDGLDNFYDCLIDPITKGVLAHYKLPTTYIEVMLYANSLLSDNKYIRHTDSSTRRIRRQELIAVKAYKAIMQAYGDYAKQIKHSKAEITFSMKQSAVIDLFMSDNTSSDASVINALNDIETRNAVTYKGESGLNSDRSYSLDKRTYDESMINVLGMSTGFASNVGITRAATIDMNIDDKRGYINTVGNDPEKMSSVKTLTATEALNPFGTNRDDPFRTAMTFIQTCKHMVRTEESDPLLVTNGTDEAIPYMTSDTFAFKAKGNCAIAEMTEDHIILEYKDGHKEYVNLSSTIQKNSDGGFYVPMKLIPMKGMRVGRHLKEGDIVAYDPASFSNSLGENDNIAYDVGTLTKIAILNTDEGYEDSACITEHLCDRMATDIIDVEKVSLDKTANVYNFCRVGQHVEEGDTLLIYQDAYNDEDAKILLKNLTGDEGEISELGRRTVKSPVVGKVAGIKVYRTVDVEELSDTLQDLVKKYEAPIDKLKKKLEKNNIETSELPATYKLPQSGKLKNVEGVYIEIYLEFHDKMKIGDKFVFDRANKGVIKDIIAKEDSPYTDFRPNEPIQAFGNISSFNNRMVVSPLIIGSLNKMLIELDRSVKDILGIPYDDSKV